MMYITGGNKGLGQATPASYTFTQGAELWLNAPGTAFSLIGSSLSNLSLPVAQGILFVPAAAIGILFYLMNKR